MAMRFLGRFLQVGAVGFAVDASLLWLLIYQFDLPPILSRAVSFLATIIVTFMLNARYTFNVSIRQSSMTRYTLIQMAGAAINFVSYSWLILYGPLAGLPMVALVIGSALAAVHNFLMMRRFVFAAATGKSPSWSRSRPR